MIWPNIIIPRPLAPGREIGEDVAFTVQFARLRNQYIEEYGEPCDLIGLGTAAYNVLMADEGYQKLGSPLNLKIVHDEHLMPWTGFACIGEQATLTARPIRFLPHHDVERHPFQ